jgi:hypothetical protein
MERINNKKLLNTALAAIVLFSAFVAIVIPTRATTQSEEPISAIGKIQADYKAQKITIDEYILYKAWAVFKPEKLSGTKYAVSKEEANFRRCGTPIILEIKENWNKLSPETQGTLRCNILLRPDDASGCEGNIDPLAQSIVSAHFKVHYTTVGANAVTAGYAQNISNYFEASYTAEVTNLGYSAPPSDLAAPNNGGDGKYDVYIYDLGSGLYGYTCAEQYPNTPSYSYIAMSSDYSWAPPNDDPGGDAVGAAKSTAAHEFHHAIQFRYDATEERWWMETTSVYMEDEVYPDVNDNYNYLPYWFENCDTLGLKTFDGAHEYGNFIFAKRLSEDFTDDVIREIWVECQTTDGLTAIDNVLSTKASDIETEFNEFTKANFFLEDMYVDGAGYRTALTGTTTFNGVWIEYQYDAATDGLPFTINSTNVNWDAWIDTWAADYVTLTLDAGTANYRICFNGLDNTTDYLVNLVTEKGAVVDEQIFSPDCQKDGYVDLAYDTYDNVVLIIMNAGSTDTTDPSWEVKIMESESTPPANVSGFTATPGNGRVSLSWVNPTDSDFACVRILRKTGSYPANSCDGTVVYNGTGTSTTDAGLTGSTTYYYTAFSYDEALNYSSGSQARATTSGSGGGVGGFSGGCFIVTACYGTPMAEEVRVLSEFRDERLLTNPAGKVFVNTYYKISPPVADFIREHPVLKSVVIVTLKPLIWMSEEIIE